MDVKELMALSHNIPYDDRINMKAEISDLKYPLLVNYLEEVKSNLLGNLEVKTVNELANDLRIADGPKEYFKPLNVGLLHRKNSFPIAESRWLLYLTLQDKVWRREFSMDLLINN